MFPLAGFFSKESVLVAAEHAAHGDAVIAPWAGWMVLIVAVTTIAVTAAYALRLWLVMWVGPRAASLPRVHEASAVMYVPLVLLAIPTVLLGTAGLSEGWLPAWIQASVTEPLAQPVALTPQPWTIAMSGIALLLGFGLGVRVARRWAGPANGFGSFVASGMGVDAVYDALVVRPFLWLVNATTAFDRGVLERGVSSVGSGTVGAGTRLQRLQGGNVQRYVSTAIAALIVAVVVTLVTVAT